MELTKAEEEVMQLIWERGPSFVKELVEAFPEPKPAVTTVSTIVRILEKKGAVGYEKFGKTHRYHALVSKGKYRTSVLRSVIQRLFGSNEKLLVSHLIEAEDLTVEEVDELLKEMKTEKP